MSPSLRAAVLLGAVAALLAPAPAPASAASPAAVDCPAIPGGRGLPSVDALLGRPLTASPLAPDETVRYLDALDAASSRVVTATAGISGQGRPLRYAIVADPRSLTDDRLSEIGREAQAVRAGRTGPRSVARAAGNPTIVWLGGGVHANEPSGTTALLATIHRLAAGDRCDARRVLRNVVTIVMPDQNPDGHVTGTRTDASGFDLNRDWFAAARPETAGRLGLLRRYPPTVTIDLHEQSGSDYFAPPYAAPVVQGLPSATRRFADGPISTAVSKALRRSGAAVMHRTGYDLLFPGYADSATSLLFGSGGMTFEQGSDLTLPEKTRRHETAALAALGAVAGDHRSLIRGWAAGFARAVAEGRDGRSVGGRPVHGWVLRTDAHAADATALATRLQTQGVEVRALREDTRIRRYRPLGAATAESVRLPAGTLVVPADQPLRRWLDALLSRDADEAGDDSTGTDSWSLPRLAGVESGTLERPLGASQLGPVAAVRSVRAASPAQLEIPGDSAVAATLVVGLLNGGRSVQRGPSGRYVVAADDDVARRISGAGIRARPLPGGEAPGDPLVRPVVAVVTDDAPALIGPPALLPGDGERPSGWLTKALLDAGVATREVASGDLGTEALAGTTHLVLGPGTLAESALSASPARAAVDRFVRAGGRVVAVGAPGSAALANAGLSAVTLQPPPSSRAVNVAAVPSADPIGRALGGSARVVIHGEPRLTAPAAAGTTVALRAAAGDRLAPSGPVGAAEGLAGRPLVVSERLGSGQVLTVGFSPAFRGQSAGGVRVLLGLLLRSR